MDSNPQPEDWAATSRSLRELARSLRLQDADAEDVAQNTVITALTRPPRFASRAWFERVLKNRARDHRRNARTRQERHAELEPSDCAPSTADISEQIETYRLMTEAVQRLAPEQREAIFLRYFEGLTPTEIAKRLGTPVKTVKTRLNRALTTLRHELARQRGDEWRALLAPLCAWRPETALPLAPILTGGIIMSKRIATVLVVFGLGMCGLYFCFSALGWPFASQSVVEQSVGEVASRTASTQDPVAAEAAVGESAKADEKPDSDAGERALVDHDHILVGKLRVKMLWYDGTRAANVVLRIYPSSGGYAAFKQKREVSDAGGYAHFDALTIGKYNLRSNRGGHEDVEITSAATTEIEFTIDEQVDVEGTVVDAQGSAIHGATIWLTAMSTKWGGMSVVGQSGPDGHFALRSIPADQSLGAVLANYSPSKLIDLEDIDTTQPPAHIELVLSTVGGNITGIVRSADEKPVANALVCIGESRRHPGRIGFKYREIWSPRTVRTDRDGRYRIDGIVPGKHNLSVRDDGHPVWRGSVEVEAEPTLQYDVQLLAGATLTGTVTDSEGNPVEGAGVNAFDIAPREDFIQMGQIDYDEIFGYPKTQTDTEGRYRLDRITPGKVTVIAIEPGKGMKTRIRATREFVCESGEDLVWDAVLDPGATIEGIVLYRDGAPMKRHFLSARSASTGSTRTMTTDEEGKFRFTNLEDASFTIGVQFWDAPKGAKPLVRDGVRPGGQPLRLVAPFDAPTNQKPGSVRGRVEDVAGRLAHTDALRVIVSRERSWYSSPELDGMAFFFKRIKPGRVRAIIFSGEEVIAQSDWFELGEGEDLDLGTIVTKPGGSLRIQVTRARGADEVKPKLWLTPTPAIRGRSITIDGNMISVPNLSVGEYTYRCSGAGILERKGALTIRVGEEASLALDLAPAADQRFAVHLPDGVGTGSLSLVLMNEAGEKVWDRNTLDISRYRMPYRPVARIPIGRYSVAAKLESGQGATQQFEVHQHGTVPDVVLRLR